MDWKCYEKKRVYVQLNSNRVYSGVIEEITYLGKESPSNIDIWLFLLRDKFDKMISFTNKEIRFMEEEE